MTSQTERNGEQQPAIAGVSAEGTDDACRRKRLAALGRVVEELTSLRAVVQEPVDGGLVLYVTPSYKSDVRETVSCELREGTWFFYYEWGDPICSADELTRAARSVASIMGIRI